MKKLLLTLFLHLIALSSVSYGEEINSLFGITLNDNAENYVSSNYIDSNKLKNTETIKGYFDLNVTNIIKVNSPYASNYWVTLDNNNIVHSIYGDKEYANLSICQAVKETLLSTLEEKYNIDFEYWEPSFPEFKVYSNYHHTRSGDYLAIQCHNNYEESSVFIQIYIDSLRLFTKKREFYDSGL